MVMMSNWTVRRQIPLSDAAPLRRTTTRLRRQPTPYTPRPERRVVAVRAETGRKTSFSAGFVIGGVICGVLGFLYAPQISKALLDEQQRLRVPQFLRDRTPRPVTKEEVLDRLDELHSALDQLSQDMGDTKPDEKEAAVTNGHAETRETVTTTTTDVTVTEQNAYEEGGTAT